METGCLFKTMLLILSFLALPLLIFGQSLQMSPDHNSSPKNEAFRTFIGKFPTGGLPYEISVSDLQNIPETSDNQEIEYQYSQVYPTMTSAMYSRSGGQTTYYFDRKLLETERYILVSVEQRQWRQAGNEYAVVVFDKKGNLLDERNLAGVYYDQIQTYQINEKGEFTVNIYEKIRNEQQTYKWNSYDKLKKSKTFYLKITTDGQFEYFTPESVTGSIKN